MDVFGLVQSEIIALELEKLTFTTLFTLCKYRPIKTKLGHNMYDHNISDEFDYGLNQTRMTGFICP